MQHAVLSVVSYHHEMYRLSAGVTLLGQTACVCSVSPVSCTSPSLSHPSLTPGSQRKAPMGQDMHIAGDVRRAFRGARRAGFGARRVTFGAAVTAAECRAAAW